MTGIAALDQDLFATADSSHLKIWQNGKALSTLEVNHKVTLMTPMHTSSDYNLVYVEGQKLRMFSLKLGWSQTLLANNTEITALCQVDCEKHLVSFGQANGVVKDLDTKSKQVVRRASGHK